jgi:hypothetical protein
MWWSSPNRPWPWRRRSSGGSSSPFDGGGGEGGSDNVGGEGRRKDAKDAKDAKVARVAFLITSDQRRRLSDDLGYAPEDIRTLKPIEAMLLLEHGVRRDGDDGGGSSSGVGHDYRTRLESLMNEEHERSTKGGQLQSRPPSRQRQEQILDRGDGGGAEEVDKTIDGGDECDDDGDTTTIDIRHKHSGGTQRMRAKPDVVTALRSAMVDEGDAMREREEEEVHGRVHESRVVVVVAVGPATGGPCDENGTPRGAVADGDGARGGPSPESKAGGIVMIEQHKDHNGDGGKGTSLEAAEDDGILSLAPPPRPPAYYADLVSSDPSDLLRIKPDVAAVILASRRRSEGKPLGERDDDSAKDDADDDDGEGGSGEEEGGACWYEVIDRSPPAATTASASIDGRVGDNRVRPTTAGGGGGGGALNEERGGGERVVALFQTRKEALECVRIKRSILRNRSGGESNSLDGIYHVRRRWVV